MIMSEIPAKCKICKGGCCEGDIKLFGFMPEDLKNLALFNLVNSFLPNTFIDLNTMYPQLIATNAPDGYYTLQNDELGKDIDGIRLGQCNACVNGVCLLEDTKPHPCRIMEYEGPACLKIFTKKLAERTLDL